MLKRYWQKGTKQKVILSAVAAFGLVAVFSEMKNDPYAGNETCADPFAPAVG